MLRKQNVKPQHWRKILQDKYLTKELYLEQRTLKIQNKKTTLKQGAEDLNRYFTKNKNYINYQFVHEEKVQYSYLGEK